MPVHMSISCLYFRLVGDPLNGRREVGHPTSRTTHQDQFRRQYLFMGLQSLPA